MKIGILTTSFFGLPPHSYGGAELVTWNTAKGLIELGHKVILYASDTSQTPPKGFLFKTGPTLNSVNVNWLEEEKQDWERVKHTFSELDIIMGDAWFGFEYASKKENPNLKVCHRHHGHLSPDWWCKSTPPFKLNMIAISEHMRNLYETGYDNRMCKIPARVCHNGIDLHAYPLRKEKGDRLLFLGRIDPVKGVHVAIQVAEEAKTPIDIVGATEFVSNKEYVHEIRTKCSQSEYANFVGEVSHEDKVKYLQNAKALIAASSFGEPFGLHFVEALSCGTPVISTDDGAAKEIITEDVGFICDSVEKMVGAVSKLNTISTEDCRKRAEQFSYQKICETLLSLYRLILDGEEW